MKVYAIYVEATNNETYEDFYGWNYIYKLFSTEEKAIDFINNEENLISLVQTDETGTYYMGIKPKSDWPVQLFFKEESTSKEKIFKAAAYDAIYSEKGYRIGYKQWEYDNDVPSWDLINYKVSIEEMEVE